MPTPPPFVLASQSPRRQELLSAAGFHFRIESADVDETPRQGEPADVYVARLAEAKARAVLARQPQALVLGADTTVVVDGDILAKPDDAADATRMVRRLAGRAHEVLTGVALVSATWSRVAVAATTVWFAPMSAAEIEAYVATGEPMDKAGAYGIQGRAARYVTRIEGSYSNVVGLPVALVHDLLAEYPDRAPEVPAPGGQVGQPGSGISKKT